MRALTLLMAVVIGLVLAVLFTIGYQLITPPEPKLSAGAFDPVGHRAAMALADAVLTEQAGQPAPALARRGSPVFAPSVGNDSPADRAADRAAPTRTTRRFADRASIVRVASGSGPRIFVTPQMPSRVYSPIRAHGSHDSRKLIRLFGRRHSSSISQRMAEQDSWIGSYFNLTSSLTGGSAHSR